MAEQEFIIPVTEEEYLSAGSKWVVFPPGAKAGDSLFLNVECGMPDWDTPNQSMKFPIVITEEGINNGKEDKISTGVAANSVWKLRELSKAVLQRELSMTASSDGKSRPVIKPMEWVGKPAIGHWQLTEGTKGGVPGAERTIYPKLIELLPPGEKPVVSGLM